MAVTINVALRNIRADQITAFAGANAKLRVDTAGYVVLLYESICAATLAPAASNGILNASPIESAYATGAGTAALARLYKADGTTMVIEGLTVGTVGTNVIITSTVVAVKSFIQTSAFTLTEGNP